MTVFIDSVSVHELYYFSISYLSILTAPGPALTKMSVIGARFFPPLPNWQCGLEPAFGCQWFRLTALSARPVQLMPPQLW